MHNDIMEGSNKEKRILKKRNKLLFELGLSNAVNALKEERRAKKLRLEEDTQADCECEINEEFSESNRGETNGPKEANDVLLERKTLRETRMIFGRLSRTDTGLEASLEADNGALVPDREIEPLAMIDVQALFALAVLKKLDVVQPRWCSVDCGVGKKPPKRAVAVLVSGVSVDDYRDSLGLQQFFRTWADACAEVLAPARYSSSLMMDFSWEPLQIKSRKSPIDGIVRWSALTNTKKLLSPLRRYFPMETSCESKKRAFEEEMQDHFQRRILLEPGMACKKTDLLLSVATMIEECIPLPGMLFPSAEAKSFALSKPLYAEVTKDSPLFALDCEMCITEGGQSELTRIAIVDENLQVVYETLVKPRAEITNYLTAFSGITEALLKDVEVRLEDVQKAVQELLPSDAILVGHSICSDLRALRLFHPYLIDTSLIYNMTGMRERKTKLKTLSSVYLGQMIQADLVHGHNPVEDATAAMKLVLLKLQHDLTFGDTVLGTLPESVWRRMKDITSDTSDMDLHPEQSTLEMLMEHKKAVVVMGPLDIMQRYRDRCADRGQEKKLNLISSSCQPRLVQAAAENVNQHDASVIHLLPDRIALENPTTIQNCRKVKLQDSLERIYKSCETGTLFMVIFSGSRRVNGACFVGIKTNA